jgi:hypothetical protein
MARQQIDAGDAAETVWFPVHHVRGGTSTGLIIDDAAAPADRLLREELLRHLMGVPLEGTSRGNSQITGLGRGIPTSNKVFFARVLSGPDEAPRLASTLAQLAADTAGVDWSVNCGNMSAALPLWALDRNLFPAMAGLPEAEIEIFNTNTATTMTARLQRAADGGWITREIAGVAGAFPSVDLFLQDPVGAKTGALLPTGRPLDMIGGVAVSCVDVAVPMVIARAADFGKTAAEPMAELEADAQFIQALRAVWIEAGLRMGLRDRAGALLSREAIARSETIPKVCIVGAPTRGGEIAARYFTPQNGHRTFAVSGGCCLAAACLVPGTVAHATAAGLPKLPAAGGEVAIRIEHPAGLLATVIGARPHGDGIVVSRAAYQRNAQILLRGSVPLYRASAALRAALAATDRGAAARVAVVAPPQSAAAD